MEINLERGRWSKATRTLYSMFWRRFAEFCADRSVEPLPAAPATIADFMIGHSDDHSTSWLSSALTAIVQVHELYGHSLNVKATVIRDTWAEIRRQKGTANTPKDALARDEIRRVVLGIPEKRLQDRAVLLLGFYSAMRRSELVALNRADLVFNGDLMVTIRRSKTDKAGAGVVICVPRTGGELCPVAALETWLAHAEITEGAVFRNRAGDRMVPRKVADIAKRWAQNAGYDPAKIGAHSLRRGCITSMFRAGGDLKNIMAHSRHAGADMALRYVQAETAQKNPAIRLLSLA